MPPTGDWLLPLVPLASPLLPLSAVHRWFSAAPGCGGSKAVWFRPRGRPPIIPVDALPVTAGEHQANNGEKKIKKDQNYVCQK
jgi:hypothetical protein